MVIALVVRERGMAIINTLFLKIQLYKVHKLKTLTQS